MCMLHVSLTTNDDYFPENFNWLFFVIAVDCVLCEKGTQFLAYFLSLCVCEESKLLRLLSWCVMVCLGVSWRVLVCPFRFQISEPFN